MLIIFVSFVFVFLYIFVLKKYIEKYKGYKRYILFMIIPIIIFIKFASELIEDELIGFDNISYNIIKTISSEKMTMFMKIVSQMGSSVVIATLTLATIFSLIYFKKDKIYWKLLIFNLLIALGMNMFLKYTFVRPRPDVDRLVQASGFSFPSAHAMISLCFYGYIAYILLTNMKSNIKYVYATIIYILIFLIGISRIYLGVHYASDVVAGYFAGTSILAISCTCVKYVKDHKVI